MGKSLRERGLYASVSGSRFGWDLKTKAKWVGLSVAAFTTLALLDIKYDPFGLAPEGLSTHMSDILVDAEAQGEFARHILFIAGTAGPVGWLVGLAIRGLSDSAVDALLKPKDNKSH